MDEGGGGRGEGGGGMGIEHNVEEKKNNEKVISESNFQPAKLLHTLTLTHTLSHTHRDRHTSEESAWEGFFGGMNEWDSEENAPLLADTPETRHNHNHNHYEEQEKDHHTLSLSLSDSGSSSSSDRDTTSASSRSPSSTSSFSSSSSSSSYNVQEGGDRGVKVNAKGNQKAKANANTNTKAKVKAKAKAKAKAKTKTKAKGKRKGSGGDEEDSLPLIPAPKVGKTKTKTKTKAKDKMEESETTTTATSVFNRRNQDPREALVIPQRTEVGFVSPETGATIAMEARVDTGASLTAIPIALQRSLGLEPVRMVKIRTGIDHTERRDVVMVGIRIADDVYVVEASVRTGKKLGRIPILGRNFLALANFLVSVQTEAILPPVSLSGYITWLDEFIAHGGEEGTGAPSGNSSALARATPGASDKNKNKKTGKTSKWAACFACCRPGKGKKIKSHSNRTVPEPESRSETEYAGGVGFDDDENDRVVHVIDHMRTSQDEILLRLPASQYPDSAVDSVLILEEMIDVEFHNPSSRQQIPGVAMNVRVDTGASLTAIPVAVSRQLELKSQGKVRIRMGNDATDVRDIVAVDIVLHGQPYEVRASVRDGAKLGKTAIIGRNMLAAAHALIRVADPSRRSVPASKSKSKSKSKAKAKSKSKRKGKGKRKGKE